MSVSIVDMFSIGIGPSSSHTVGPMRAAKLFVDCHSESQTLKIKRVYTELFGALGFTGIGHGTDKAVVLGLESFLPEQVDPKSLQSRFTEVCKQELLMFGGKHKVDFQSKRDLKFHRKKILKKHTNGMRFSSFADNGELIQTREYYSVGGGFVWDGEDHILSSEKSADDHAKESYPFHTAEELLQQCHKTGLSISKIMLENEKIYRNEQETRDYLLGIWEAMESCMLTGFKTEGVLPGGIGLKRRAHSLCQKLKVMSRQNSDPLMTMDWINLYALSVSEENAGGGRVVTAPTNGAAGVIPAVIAYYRRFIGDDSDEGICQFLLTAGAIGTLYKKNASISGAEVGCQGEIGVACSMAAAGLAEVLGGTPEQIENAAEIGMEHNLGLTCDPVGGLVQVPCIERNAMGAVKAINAARLALLGDGQHKVHLDKAIETMFQTGLDMKTKYKETSRGGLAVNVIEC